MVEQRKKRLVWFVLRRRVMAEAKHSGTNRESLIILTNGVECFRHIAGVDNCLILAGKDFKLTEHKWLANVYQWTFRFSAAARLRL